MQAENRAAVTRIVNHLNESFGLELSVQYISQVENIVGVLKNSLRVDDSALIKVVRMLLDEEIFLPAEVIEIDSQDIEDDVLYVTRNRSIGTLNQMLIGTLIRVTQVDNVTEIVKLSGVM